MKKIRIKKLKEVPNTLRKVLYSTLRKSRIAVVRSHAGRSVRRFAKMEAHKALKLFFKFAKFQISIRPRMRLIAAVTLILIFALIASSTASEKLKAKESEIKVNGQAILVADKTDALNAPVPLIESSIGVVKSPFDFTRPALGYISQGYRAYHRAVDITGEFGSPIKPLGSGKVAFAGFMGDGHGNTVIVDHENGMKSLYAHMSKINVGVGNEVRAGSTIGYIGLTGHTTGPHVHVEVSDNGIAIDPAKLLPE